MIFYTDLKEMFDCLGLFFSERMVIMDHFLFVERLLSERRVIMYYFRFVESLNVSKDSSLYTDFETKNIVGSSEHMCKQFGKPVCSLYIE